MAHSSDKAGGKYKYLRTGIYWRDEARVRRVQRLQADEGASSESDLIRRVVDRLAEQRGLYHDPETAKTEPVATRAGGQGW